MESTDYLHPGPNSEKLKVDPVGFLVGLVKNGRSRLVHETLKSALS